MDRNCDQRLQLRLLGVAELSVADEPMDARLQNKALALLAYLAIEQRAFHRDQLSDLLWPALSAEAARANLRKTLFRLRQALGGGMEPILQVRGDSVQLAPDLYWLDVTDFFRHTPSCASDPPENRCPDCLKQMECAIARYRGPLLDGLSIDGAPEFEGWLCIRREQVHRQMLGLLERASDCHYQHGQIASALMFSQRYVELEPLDESGHRRLIRYLAESGQCLAAQAQYQSCRRMLQQELGASPDAQTDELFEQIRSNQARRECVPVAIVPASVTEQRQVTALYCSVTAADSEDPEEIGVRFLELQHEMHDQIRHHGGFVSQMHGGAMLGYFGYPAACENSAHRAVRAALSLQQLACHRVNISMGIHAGFMISSNETPDLLGRISTMTLQLCDPQRPITISDSTRLLIAGYFCLDPLGAVRLQGEAEPVERFAVTGESGTRHRLEAAERLTPWVGRAEELRSLHEIWSQCLSGERRVVLIQGEAGIGKSRLVHTLKEQLGDALPPVRELRCFPEYSQSPYHPLIVLFEIWCCFKPGDSDEEKLGKIAWLIQHYYPQADPLTLPLIAHWLSIPCCEPIALSPGRQRERLNAILLDLMHTPVDQKPIVYVVEDLHWIDPSTRELLLNFIHASRPGTVMMLMTARPEFDPPWQEECETSISLQALPDSDISTMIDELVAGIPQHCVEQIVARADGVPFFAEELARMAGEGGDTIPATLHDLLAVRLDSLGEIRQTAQIASAIGREFDAELLHRVASIPPQLDLLLDSGLIQRCGDHYQFKHALIQQAAYQSMVKSGRQLIHRSIAAALQSFRTDTAPEIIARHWEAGGENCEAIGYWIKAGQFACSHSAYQEAAAHFHAGLRLIPQLSDESNRNQLEFSLQVGLGMAFHSADGYGSSRAGDAFSRAMQLCDQMASPEMFQSTWGIWVSMLGHFPSALVFARKLSPMATQIGDPMLLLQANYVMGNSLFWLGQFEAARDHSLAALSIYQPSEHARLTRQFGADPAVTAGIFLAASLGFMGQPVQAQQACDDYLSLARKQNHPNTLGFALTAAATLAMRLRRADETLKLAQEGIELAGKHPLPLWKALSIMLRGWALVMLGDAEGVVHIQQSIVAVRQSMQAISTIFLSSLVDAHLKLAQYAEALTVLDEVMESIRRSGDEHYVAEIYRLHGEALLGMGDEHRTEAERDFHQALETAVQQGANMPALRAAKSLARHFNDDEPLSRCYAAFDEGFDTVRPLRITSVPSAV